jgi:hypothetical protein
MPDISLEHWIRDFEAKFYTEKARPYTPINFIHDLRHKSKVLGVGEFKTKSETIEIIYCYIPSNKPGLIHGYILKRENGQIGSYISYGYISLDDFITNHTPLKPKEESKTRKYALPAFIGAIIPVTYVGLKKFLGKKEG